MKKALIIFLTLILGFMLTSCGGAGDKTVRLSILTGPTGLGIAYLYDQAEQGNTSVKYEFTAMQAPDEIVARISSGEADLAIIATNLASKLYAKTGGKIQIIGVNTLGVLSVLDYSGAEIKSMADLVGKHIVTTGQGANPQYVIEYLLRENGIDPEKDVKIDYKADGTELQTVWSTDQDAVIIAPCPVSTSILMKYEGARKVLDLTDEWDALENGSKLMQGCIVGMTDFVKENPEIIKQFMADYEASVKMTETNPEQVGELCEKFGIIPKAALAKKAIPDCHLCFITGDEMKQNLTGFLKVLADADIKSVGALPDDGFWYMGD